MFLVFDRDRHTTDKEAIAKAGNLKFPRSGVEPTVKAIPSIPCFEIWYLFHVTDKRRPYPVGSGTGSPSQDLIRDLKSAHSCFAAYDKATCDAFYDTLVPL